MPAYSPLGHFHRANLQCWSTLTSSIVPQRHFTNGIDPTRRPIGLSELKLNKNSYSSVCPRCIWASTFALTMWWNKSDRHPMTQSFTPSVLCNWMLNNDRSEILALFQNLVSHFTAYIGNLPQSQHPNHHGTSNDFKNFPHKPSTHYKTENISLRALKDSCLLVCAHYTSNRWLDAFFSPILEYILTKTWRHKNGTADSWQHVNMQSSQVSLLDELHWMVSTVICDYLLQTSHQLKSTNMFESCTVYLAIGSNVNSPLYRKLKINTRQMRVKIGIGEYMILCQSPVGQ